ncbi:hypothetical protein HK099_007437 [Clydaea vesicula]|uniref:Dpy-30-like protein n=1 Tax=Clydaea vesicula TaxID=447962 RepID=A0AAD5U5H1_9FUNG|nr:hypothetical protein HK099_007437 [Clydaea vesicula]KAJ3388787.1 hypothetical protein HDU92_001348 [Lobulomyces angularis]
MANTEVEEKKEEKEISESEINTTPAPPAIQINKELLEITKLLNDAVNSSSLMTDKSQLLALPVRSYLDATVVPVLVEGLKSLVKERPPNACEYLALYLLRESKCDGFQNKL